MITVVTKKSLGSGDYHHIVVHKGGSGSGDFQHSGRPGKVGGSSGKHGKVAKPKKSPTVDSYDQIEEAKYGESGITSKGYFILPDGKLMDVNDEFGPGTNDHVGWVAAVENPELVGLTKREAKKFEEAYVDLGGEEIMDYWVKIHKFGVIRVREFGNEVDIDTYDNTPSTLRRLQRLWDDGKLGIRPGMRVFWTNMADLVNYQIEGTLEEFLDAHRVVNGEFKESIVVTKGGEGSGDYGHAGIPGHQGGSLPGRGHNIQEDELKACLVENSSQLTDKGGSAGIGAYISPDGKMYDTKVSHTEFARKILRMSTEKSLSDEDKVLFDKIGAQRHQSEVIAILNGWDRVDVTKSEINIQTKVFDTSTLRKIQSYFTSGLIKANLDDKVVWEGMSFLNKEDWKIHSSRGKLVSSMPWREFLTYDKVIISPNREITFKELVVVKKGGAGSGHHGHAGRPGRVGGSARGHQRLGDMTKDEIREEVSYAAVQADWLRQHRLASYHGHEGNRAYYVYEDDDGNIAIRTYENGVGRDTFTRYGTLHEANEKGQGFLRTGEIIAGGVTPASSEPTKIIIHRPKPPKDMATGHTSEILKKFGSHISESDADAAANTFYSVYGMELDDFMKGAYEQDFGNNIVSRIKQSKCSVYTEHDGTPYRLSIYGEIYDDTGFEHSGLRNQIGYFERSIELDPKNKTINHGHFEIDVLYRERGIGSAFYMKSEDTYIKAGVDRVELFANLTVGGYAWARMGFDFADSFKGKLLAASAVRNWERYTDKKWTGKKPKHAWEVAAVTAPDGYQIGKQVMLGEAWEGYKSLNKRSTSYKVGQLYYDAKKKK